MLKNFLTLVFGIIFVVTSGIYYPSVSGQVTSNSTDNILPANDQNRKVIVYCFTDADGDGYKQKLVSQGLIDSRFGDYTCSEINRMVVEQIVKLALRIFG